MITYFLLFLNTILLPEITNETIHDFHFSQVQMEYATEQKEWQISMQVFIDDLEQAMEIEGQPKLRLGMKRELPSADSLIEEYIKERFKLYDLQGETLEYKWIGKEMTEDFASFWIYFFVENTAPSNGLRIENRLLTHLFEDQQNQVDILGPYGANKQLLFNKDYYQEKILFQKD